MNTAEEKLNELKDQIEKFTQETAGKNEELKHRTAKSYRGQKGHYLDKKSLREKKEK